MEDNNRIEQSKVQQNKIECKIECNIIEQGKALMSNEIESINTIEDQNRTKQWNTVDWNRQ